MEGGRKVLAIAAYAQQQMRTVAAYAISVADMDRSSKCYPSTGHGLKQRTASDYGTRLLAANAFSVPDMQ
eukprot:2236538-Rhodomonas_salina.3